MFGCADQEFGPVRCCGRVEPVRVGETDRQIVGLGTAAVNTTCLDQFQKFRQKLTILESPARPSSPSGEKDGFRIPRTQTQGNVTLWAKARRRGMIKK